jgi:hypothetical protein
MTTRSKLVVFVASVGFAAQAAGAAGIDAKAWDGIWHLNAAASKWATNKEQSETRSYSYSDGKLTMKSSSKDDKGKQTDFTYSAALDGKSSPMTGNPNADSISITSVSAHEIKATSRMKGKVTVQSDAIVSADGKHLTIKRTYVAQKGAPTETLVFDR